MKQCGVCKESKPLDDFSWKSKAAGTKQARCKLCQKEYAANHYKDNKSDYVERAQRTNVGYRETNRAYIIEYLKSHPCIDCGQDDIIVLEFDHREPVRQRGGRIGNFLACSLKKMQEEIAKCDVVCANCHARRTAKMFGWGRLDHI